MRRFELGLWAVVGTVLAALAIPWFMWGDATVVAGLPAWVWWHVGWMVLVALVFALFANRAWGIGIERSGPEADGGDVR